VDARSQVGRWVGFDMTSSGHRIYWEHKRSIGVERSVKFDSTHVLDPPSAPFEGEEESTGVKRSTVAPKSSSTPPVPSLNDGSTTSTEVTDPLGGNFEHEDTSGGRGKRVRKESEYLERIRRGEGVVSAKPGDPKVPTGVQSGARKVPTLEEGRHEKGRKAPTLEEGRREKPIDEEEKKEYESWLTSDFRSARLIELSSTGVADLI
jgi:hypothetical protein